jgi:hypothetical protein
LPLRKAKMVVEKAVKYSEQEGKDKVSYQGLKKALGEMEIDILITLKEVDGIQRPGRILTRVPSIGTPSEKRTRKNMISLRAKVKTGRVWLIHKKRMIERANALVLRMEKE